MCSAPGPSPDPCNCHHAYPFCIRSLHRPWYSHANVGGRSCSVCLLLLLLSFSAVALSSFPVAVGRLSSLEGTNMGKRSLLSGVVTCRWKAWKLSEGNKLEVADT